MSGMQPIEVLLAAPPDDAPTGALERISASLDTLPADISDAWWEALVPIAIQRRRYAFVARRTAGRQMLLDLFRHKIALRHGLLDALRPYLETDPAAFDAIPAKELAARFAYCDSGAYRAAADAARGLGAEALAAAFDETVAAALPEEAFAPEYTRVLSSSAYGPDDMKDAGAKNEALRNVRRAALARVAEAWWRMLTDDAARC